MELLGALFDNPPELSSNIKYNEAPFSRILKTVLAVLEI
jgi:hypothetical protein